MPKSYRQWVFAKPMHEDVLGPEQFALREHPIPNSRQARPWCG